MVLPLGAPASYDAAALPVDATGLSQRFEASRRYNLSIGDHRVKLSLPCNAKPSETDDEDEAEQPRHKHRPLHRGEIVPHIPTLFEQLDTARLAVVRASAKAR